MPAAQGSHPGSSAPSAGRWAPNRTALSPPFLSPILIRPDMYSHDLNSDTLVAVVGMAGRFPGAPDVDSLWRLLSERGDAIRPIPKERWDTSMQLDPEKTVQSVGGFL